MSVQTTDRPLVGASAAPRVRIVAKTPEFAQARELILAHLGWIESNGVDIHHAQAELGDELANLAGWYAPPRGTLLLATLRGAPVGVVGVHVHPGRVAELKRLFVRPEARGHHVGEHLVRMAIATAGELGCRTIWLESIPGLMDTAIALYRRLGFRPSARFGGIPIRGAICLERPVGRASKPAA